MEQSWKVPSNITKIEDPETNNIVALILWKLRHLVKPLVIRITPDDCKAFSQSLEYNEQQPIVKIEKRAEVILVHMTDEKTGDQIIFTENNEADLEKAQASEAVLMARTEAKEVARQLRADSSSGNFSTATMDTASRLLETLSEIS